MSTSASHSATHPYRPILYSSPWPECGNNARLAWVALLGMADSKGVVDAAIHSVANFAGLSLDEARAATEELAQVFDGMKYLEKTKWGWRILNFYVNPLAAKNAERQRRFRERRRAAAGA